MIDLKEDDPPTVRRMLTYLYTLDYDDAGEDASIEQYMLNTCKAEKTTVAAPLSEEESSAFARVINHVAVYAVADKYDIFELKMLATTKFGVMLHGQGRTLAAWLPAVVHAVFETTPDTDSGLRNVVFEFCKASSSLIINDENFNGMVKEHGELGLAMLRDAQSNASMIEQVRKQSFQIFDSAFNLRMPSRGDIAHAFIAAERDLSVLQVQIEELKGSFTR